MRGCPMPDDADLCTCTCCGSIGDIDAALCERCWEAGCKVSASNHGIPCFADEDERDERWSGGDNA